MWIFRLTVGRRDSSLIPMQCQLLVWVAANRVSSNVIHRRDHGRQYRAHIHVPLRLVRALRGLLVSVTGGSGGDSVGGDLCSGTLRRLIELSLR